jgi:PAS domain S-box-containing protein
MVGPAPHEQPGSAGLTLFTLDRDGRIAGASGSAGAALEQAVGRSVFDACAEAAWLCDLVREALGGTAAAGAGPLGDRWLEVRCLPLTDAAGAGAGIAGVALDVQAQRLAEEALEDDNLFRQAVIARASEGLCICHQVPAFPYVAFTLWNDRMTEITGYTMEEINRRGWYQSLYPDPDVQARAIERMGRMREGTDLITEEWTVTHADGAPRILSISTAVLRTDAGVTHVLGVMRDMTARRRAEAERDRMLADVTEAVRLRDEFLSIASHELYTPVTSLMLAVDGIAQAAARGLPSPEALRKLAATAARQTRRLAQLVEALLDVSRIEAARLDLSLDDVDLAAVVTDVASRLEHDIARAGCQLQLDLEPTAGTWNRLRLEQVVTNLLSNAVKYGAQKPIQVRVRRADGTARLSVADQGIGIDPARQGRIFERFERAVPAGNFGGLGLGLYICRRIVEAHGGTVGVASRPGEGATFTVTLPLTPRLVRP